MTPKIKAMAGWIHMMNIEPASAFERTEDGYRFKGGGICTQCERLEVLAILRSPNVTVANLDSDADRGAARARAAARNAH